MEMTTLTEESIRAQLNKVIANTRFRGAHRAIRLLQFIVEQMLAGQASALKEFTLGVDGLGRGPSFDPRIDSIVRVEASRLRNRLELYYSNEGASDPVLITLPKGSYVPVFEPLPAAIAPLTNLGNRTGTNSNVPPSDIVSAFRPNIRLRVVMGLVVLSVLVVGLVNHLRPSSASYPQSLAVLPFSTEEQTEYLADGLTENLINNLSRLSSLRVTARSIAFSFKGKATDPIQIAKQLNVGTVVTGRFVMHDGTFTVQIEMVNAESGTQTWGERYEGKLADILSVQEKIATQITDH